MGTIMRFQRGMNGFALIVSSCVVALCASDVWAQTSTTAQARFSGMMFSDWGPFESSDETIRGENRQRVLGPLYEHQDATGNLRFAAVRPFWSSLDDSPGERALSEYLWPVASVRDLNNDRSWRVLFAYGHDFDTTEATRYRSVVFPVFTMGRTSEDENYAGLFPLLGDVREVLTYDRIRFALFPVYMESWKKDVHTVSWLWPVYSRAKGDDYAAARVFPFYGEAHDEEGGRRFVLWPIWTQRWSDDPASNEKGFILFPIYGNAKNPGGETYWVIPPLFKFHNSGDNRQVLSPWPFVQYSRGHVDKLYLWPLWGQKEVGPIQSSFFLWPIARFSDVQRHDNAFRQRLILPFFYYQDEISLESQERESCYFKFWPLFSYQREDDGTRLRALELWPLKRTGAIERNYAPFWTLFTRSRSGENRETELLWGLFRKRSSEEGERYLSLFPFYNHRTSDEGEREWSILKGAFGVRDMGLKKKYRVLYFFNFGGTAKADRQTDTTCAGE